MNGNNSDKVLIGAVQYGFTRNCMIEFSDVQDGDEVAEITVRYGKNLRSEKILTLKATKEGEENDIKVQNLRYKYINFLQRGFLSATSNHLAEAKN